MEEGIVCPGECYCLIDVGCIELKARKATGRWHQFFAIEPMGSVPDGGTERPLPPTEWLLGLPRFLDIVDDFLAFLNNDPLIVSDAQRQAALIAYRVGRTGRKAPPLERFIDIKPKPADKRPPKVAAYPFEPWLCVAPNKGARLHGSIALWVADFWIRNLLR